MAKYATSIQYLARLVQCSHTSLVILSAGHLDDVAIIVNIFALLLQDESLKELGEDSVGRQKVHAATILVRRKDLGNEVSRHLFGLSGQNTKGELSQLGRGIVQKKLGKDHTRRKIVHLNGAGELLLLISLNTLIQFLDQTGSELRQTALRGTIAGITGSSATLDATSDSVEDVASNSSLCSSINWNSFVVEKRREIRLHMM